MVHTSDIPAMLGIGSSLDFTKGFPLVLCPMKGDRCPETELAYDAIQLEQDVDSHYSAEES